MIVGSFVKLNGKEKVFMIAERKHNTNLVYQEMVLMDAVGNLYVHTTNECDRFQVSDQERYLFNKAYKSLMDCGYLYYQEDFYRAAAEYLIGDLPDNYFSLDMYDRRNCLEDLAAFPYDSCLGDWIEDNIDILARDYDKFRNQNKKYQGE